MVVVSLVRLVRVWGVVVVADEWRWWMMKEQREKSRDQELL